MRTLIAIGGGSFQKGETRKIDEYAISRCHSEKLKVLFLGAASRDDQGYAKRFKQYYRSLGCEVEALRLLHTKLSDEEIAKKLEEKDLLYLGAGDTTLLMEQLEAHQLIEVIRKQYEHGLVVCGLSAGANVLFNQGYSQSEEGFSLVDGMHLIEGVFCPHYQKEERKGFDVLDTGSIRKIGCVDKAAFVKEEDKEFFLEG